MDDDLQGGDASAEVTLNELIADAPFHLGRSVAAYPGEIVRIDREGAPVAFDRPERRTTPRVIAILPDEEAAFANVYGRGYSYNDASLIEAHKQRFATLGEVRLLTSSRSGASDFAQALTGWSDRSPVVIIGHTEIRDDRKHIILPDGSSVSIDDIKSVAFRKNISVIIVSCYSDDLALRRRINLAEAYRITERALRRLDEALQKGDEISVDPEALMVLAMRSELVRNKSRWMSISIGVAGVSNIGAGAYVEFSREEP